MQAVVPLSKFSGPGQVQVLFPDSATTIKIGGEFSSPALPHAEWQDTRDIMAGYEAGRSFCCGKTRNIASTSYDHRQRTWCVHIRIL